MSKGAKRASKKISKKAGGKKTKKGKKSFKSYISKVNKASKKGLTLSSRAGKILNSFVEDMFDKIATQASALARSTKAATIKAATMQAAVRITLPAELGSHAASEASKAVTTSMK